MDAMMLDRLQKDLAKHIAEVGRMLRTSDHEAGRNEDASSGLKPLADRKPAPRVERPFVPARFGYHGGR